MSCLEIAALQRSTERLLCCSNLESACEETYLLLGNVALALFILAAEAELDCSFIFYSI